MRMVFIAGLAAIASAPLLAQPPSGARQQQPPSQRPGPVSVQGCLTAAAGANQFTLTAVQDGGARATGTSGSTSGAKPAVKTIEYTLTADATVDLKPHVGHTVEVTGTESSPVGEAGGTTATPSTTAPGDVRGGAKAKVQTSAKTDIVAKQLTVVRVRDIASTCRPQP